MKRLILAWEVILQAKTVINSIEGNFDNGVFEFKIHHAHGIRGAWWEYPVLYHIGSEDVATVKPGKDVSSVFIKGLTEDVVNEFKASILVELIAHPDTDNVVKKLIGQIASPKCCTVHIPSEGPQLLLSL